MVLGETRFSIVWLPDDVLCGDLSLDVVFARTSNAEVYWLSRPFTQVRVTKSQVLTQVTIWYFKLLNYFLLLGYIDRGSSQR